MLNRVVTYAAIAPMVLALGMVTSAQAQGSTQALRQAAAGQSAFSRDRNVSVLARPHPEFAAPGVRVGTFLLSPQATILATASDNVLARTTNEESDVELQVRPEARLASTWSRHALDLSLSGNYNYFTAGTVDSFGEWKAAGSGRFDFARRSNLTVSAEQGRSAEPATAMSAPLDAAERVRFNAGQITIAGVHELNRLRLIARYNRRDFNYADVRSLTNTMIDQDFRDRTQETFTVHADYAVSPALAVYVEGIRSSRNYDRAPPVVARDQDSSGEQVLIGADFEVTGTIRADIGVGYLSQKYDDPAFSKLDGLGARAQVEWFPTQLTTVTFTASRAEEPAGLLESPGYIAKNFGARVDHEFLRNLVLSGEIEFSDADYQDIDRVDRRTGVGLRGTYIMGRSVSLFGGYSYTKQNSKGSSGSGRDFDVNILSVGLTLRR